MKVTLLPSTVSPGDSHRLQFLSTYLIDDTLAIDAGCLGLYGSPQEQARVRHVLISHSHMDHIASLPVFVENAYEGKSDSVTIHAIPAVLDSLRRDIFNDRIWPDFVALSHPEHPFLKLEALHPGTPLQLDGLRITPVPVNHAVPTVGFLVEDATSAVVIASDTGPTEEIWQRANQSANLKAVYLEVTFPNSMSALAEIAKHHTPATFAAETRKLRGKVKFLVVHLKPRYHDEVAAELDALRTPGVEIAKIGVPYEF